MKSILFFMVFIFFISCHQTNKLTQDEGKIIVEKKTVTKDSASIYGSILEFSTGDKLKLSDVWINNKKYSCDTNGNFQIQVKQGKYNIVARAFGFKNYVHKQPVILGEVINLLFCLVPYRNEKPAKFVH